MSDLDEDELEATKKLYKKKSIEEGLMLLKYWKEIYDIPLYEIDKIKNLIKEQENRHEQQ